MSSDELKVPSQQQHNDLHDDDHDRDRVRTDPVDDEEFARSEARTEDLSRHDADGEVYDDEADRERVTGRDPRADDEYAAAVPGAAVPVTGVPVTGGPVPETDPDPDPAHPAPAHAAPDDIVLFDQDPSEVQARWRDLQSSFVDDPGEAVQRADGLVGEVVESLTSTLTNRTNALRDRWKETGSSADTEQLRLALRDYRTVLERLLALSSKSPAQPAQPAPAAQPDQFQSQGMR
ncbi:hypothetical protein [Nonomuraea gerenzanensis]|uniref:Uncharacterized protein n=1 Tax=Nonomuraea gerenzanensis TaxID=93944 RepID=A0A1M4E7G9_9ACTN|nr:hypothetical protein [Nonomuraea gerenzanensis]UBU17092.1 hypothetical protein LCN96_19355 [Nonomuraea gerenzanensis]SBO94827.1 FIG01127653: hypothetical protein [Nonomuraea gerenzanensis]